MFLSPATANAQVVINEVLPNPADNDNGAEWVELYNQSDEVVPLESCVLYLDDNHGIQNIDFESEDFIEKYKTITWDSQWLNNSGDHVEIVCDSMSDNVIYGSVSGSTVKSPDEGISIGRSPNGSGNFYILSSVTVNGPNSGPPSPTPTPTTKPTSTPKPTNTPVPTNTPKPTNTPTKSPTRAIVDNDDRERGDVEETASVLSEQRDELSKDDSGEKQDNDKPRGNIPLAAGAFVVLGIGFIGAALYPFFKKRMKGYNLEGDVEEEDSGQIL